MRIAALALSLVVVLVAPHIAVGEEPLRYWGLAPNQAGRGLIDQGGQWYSVAIGDAIPGVGTVVALTNDELIVQRMLTEAERQALAARGQAGYIGQQMHFTNVNAMLRPVGRPR